jgi:hypothetical protein
LPRLADAHSTKLQAVAISNKKLYGVVGVLLLLETVLIAVWLGADMLRPVTYLDEWDLTVSAFCRLSSLSSSTELC